jgi:hypothetical protein
MPIYEIEQYELHTSAVRIEADSVAEAVAQLLEGPEDYELVPDSTAFDEIEMERGLCAERYPELAASLTEMGIDCTDIIPSICTIREVGTDNWYSEEEPYLESENEYADL